jgi:hypothetical protein
MIVSRLALRKVFITIKRKTRIDRVFKLIDSFERGMNQSRKGFCNSFKMEKFIKAKTKQSPYINGIFKLKRKDEKAIYEKLRSIYKV